MQPAKLMLVALGIAVPAGGALVVVGRAPTRATASTSFAPQAVLLADGGRSMDPTTVEPALAAAEERPKGLRSVERPAGRRAPVIVEDVDAVDPRAGDPKAGDPRAGDPPPTAEELDALIAQLRDDDVRFNATHAVWDLANHWAGPVEDRVAVWEALLPHVTSDDAQQRHIATGLLIELGALAACTGQSVTPPPALLDSVVEWLDQPPRIESWMPRVARTHEIVSFALAHVDALEGRLLDVIARPRGRDPFHHAFVLGAAGRTAHAHVIAPVLVPHLRANSRGEDACMATEALVGLGTAALPHLVGGDDEQQRLSMEAIQLEILDPTPSREVAERRGHLNVISRKYHAAAPSWRFRTSYKMLDRTGGF